MNNGDGLTNEQTTILLQFQDVTGIEDINVSRDVLIRHQWNLEVAIQEQLNIREGRPSMFASSSTDSNRLPQVVNDRFLQQIFSAHMPGGRSNLNDEVPSGFTGFFRYVVRFVVQLCYSTISSIVMTFVNLVKSDNQIVTDPLGDVVNFITAYNEKYPVHPVFYQGTYAQALNDAKRELKFLLVYLHSEAAAHQADVQSFCSQTLSDANVVDYINQNMFFWACDVSSPEGYRVSQTVMSRAYPVMVLIGLRANKMVIVGRFEGDCVADEFVRRLQAVVNENEIWLNQARADRLERSFTQSLRQQQDEAYEESLRADEEKERQKQFEREEIMRVQRAEEDERQAEEDRKNAIARLKVDLAETVPSEPSSEHADSISVVFKLPNGARVERRFLRTNSLKDVYSYIFCHPSSPDEFEITTNFPKRVLCTKDSLEATSSGSKTLAEVDIKNREVLFVNDLNA